MRGHPTGPAELPEDGCGAKNTRSQLKLRVLRCPQDHSKCFLSHTSQVHGRGQACTIIRMCGVCPCKGGCACRGLNLTYTTFPNRLTFETMSQVEPVVHRLGMIDQELPGIIQSPPLQVWDSREALLSPLCCLYGCYRFKLGSSCLLSKPFTDGVFSPAPNKWLQTRAFQVVSFEFS